MGGIFAHLQKGPRNALLQRFVLVLLLLDGTVRGRCAVQCSVASTALCFLCICAETRCQQDKYREADDREDPEWVSKTYNIDFQQQWYKGGRTKIRIPAWCDRVLYHSLNSTRNQVRNTHCPKSSARMSLSACFHAACCSVAEIAAAVHLSAHTGGWGLRFHHPAADDVRPLAGILRLQLGGQGQLASLVHLC